MANRAAVMATSRIWNPSLGLGLIRRFTLHRWPDKCKKVPSLTVRCTGRTYQSCSGMTARSAEDFSMGSQLDDLNRSVLFVQPRQAFLDWVKKDKQFRRLTLEQLQAEGTAYLLPAVFSSGVQQKFTSVYWREIFELELSAWTDKKSEWPEGRSLQMFQEWFDVGFSSLCLDLVDEPLGPL